MPQYILKVYCHQYSVYCNYRKTPNKRPWAFAATVVLGRTFSPSSSFLRNENRTIFSWDIGKNVKKTPQHRVLGVGRGVYWRGAFIGGFTVCFPILYLQRSGAHVGFSPDRSAVEIQYATVYTEGILPSIQYILQRCFPILYLYCTSVRARVLHCSFQHADLDNWPMTLYWPLHITWIWSVFIIFNFAI